MEDQIYSDDLQQLNTELKAKLLKCQAMADNHRRSRDYHKETNAALRKEIGILNDQVDYWHKEHDLISDSYLEKNGLSNRLTNVLFVVVGYAIGMTVLFYWAIRQ